MSRKILIASLFILMAVAFLTLPFNALQTDDASMYALVIKNMVQHHQWLTPLIAANDPQSFLDKPPLGLWLLALFPKLLGLSVFSVHLGNVVFYGLLLISLYFFMKRYANSDTALDAVLIAATAVALVVYSRSPKMEILLTLVVFWAHFFLGRFLQEENPKHVSGFFICLALGFLIKSGLAVILPLLTVLFIFVSTQHNRETLRGLLRSGFLYQAAILAALIVIAVLGIQFLAFKDLGWQYLQSFTITSKYNTGYLGFGFYPLTIVFTLLAIFPWTPLAFTQLRVLNRADLRNFAACWFWGSFLFFLFFYRQVDARTVVVLVPPLAILAALQLQKLRLQFKWVSGAVAGLAVILVVGYAALFLNTRALVDQANPQRTWPTIISQYRSQGYSFYIYRPHNRPLFMSNDLAWLDFVGGPADGYFYENVPAGKKMVLTDLKSWGELKKFSPQILVQDSQAILVGFSK